MLKILSVFILCKLCTAGTDYVKIYKNEVSLEIEEHILGKTIILLDESTDLKSLANKLNADLNSKYGNGWQTYAVVNFDFGQLVIDREPNTLLWFSFGDIYFYVFKSAKNSAQTLTADLRLIEGSDAYERWKNAGVPRFMSFYFFHVNNTNCGTNLKDMQLTERGPYVFEEKIYKDGIEFDERKEIVSYNERKAYTFIREKSIGSIDDNITVINIFFLGVMNNIDPGFSALFEFYIKDKIAKGQRETLDIGLFTTRTVGELLFDGYDYHFGLNLKISLFSQRNSVTRERWSVNTGVKNKDDFAKVVSYDGDNFIKQEDGYDGHTPLWNDTYGQNCNKFTGTDGTLFSPNITKNDRLYVFENQLCRNVYFDYKEESRVRDIKTFRFQIPQEYYDSPKVNAKNKCYCVEPENDFKSCEIGATLDIAYCKRMSVGSHIIMSPPYFYHGNGEYNKRVALKYDDSVNFENYGTYLDVEPKTGSTLRAVKKHQIGILLNNNSYVPELRELRERTVVPLVWFEEREEIDEKLEKQFKELVN